MSQQTTRGNSSRQLLLNVLGGVIVGATYLYLLLSRPVDVATGSSPASLIAMVGYLVGAGLLAAGSIQKLTTATLALIPVSIALNISVGQLAAVLALTVYLDSIGTVVVAILAGPAAGVVTGILTNIVWGLTINPVALPFAVVQVVIGLLAGTAARAGVFRRIWLAPIVGAGSGVLAAMISAPIAAYVFGGATGGSAGAIVGALQAMGTSLLAAATYQGLIYDPLDKAITFTVAVLLLTALPARFRHRFSFARDHQVIARTPHPKPKS